MKEIKDILNIVCDFKYDESSSVFLTGLLTMQDEEVVFKCRSDKAKLKELKEKVTITLCGEVDGTEVTLVSAMLRSYSASGFNNTDYCQLIYNPSEIIIGRKFWKKVFVKSICARMNELNHMSIENPLRVIHSFSKQNPAVVDYTYPTELVAEDDDGAISLSKTFGIGWGRDKIEFPLIPEVKYEFKTPVELMSAVAKIACARNLFTFFADYYIAIGECSFSCDDSDDEFTEYKLYFNSKEKITREERPFIISANKFSSNYDIIWKNWCDFYKKNLYIPTLFYEIICHRSTRFNSFLNLAQALEIYSTQYRNAEAKKRAKADNCNRKEIPLKYRMEDLLNYHNYCFGLSEEEIKEFAKNISNHRNFLTHYNIKRYREPSFQEVSSSGRVLRFLLLATIYKIVGIDEANIKEGKRFFSYGSIDRDIGVVLCRSDINKQNSLFE